MKTMKACAMGAAGALVLAAFSGFAPGPANAAVDEEEPNNSCQTATSIPMGTAVYGAYDGKGGDYFKFSLSQNSSVKIRFVNDKKDQQSMSDFEFGLYLYNRYQGYDQFLGNVVCRTLKPVNKTVSLARGTHYLRVAGPRGNGLISTSNPPRVGHPYHFKISYVVNGTSISRVSAGKRALTARWARKSGASSYQVRCTPASSKRLYGWSGAKTKKVSGSKSSARVSGLASAGRYYVQVRVAKSIDGKTYWSSWSGTKAVTVR